MTNGNIEALERAILNEAQADARRILADAEAETDRIQRQARERANAEAEAIQEGARKAVEALQQQTTATAQLEAQNLKLRRREALLSRAFDVARKQLPSIVEEPGYEDLARDLLHEGVVQLGGHADTLIVRADPATQKVLTEDFLSEVEERLHVNLDLGRPLTRRTGLILETPEGHWQYDNTLETRLERMREDLRSPVYRVLTEGN